MAICSICGKEVNESEAPILYMSGAGIPRLLCEDHSKLIDTVVDGRDPAEIREAIAKLGEDLVKGETDDLSVIEIINDIVKSGAERADLIENGEYDFSEDEESASDEDEFDITPDMMETEEDKAKTAEEERKGKILDTVLTWAMGLAIVAAVAFFIFKFIL